jgi:hypothetical protein
VTGAMEKQRRICCYARNQREAHYMCGDFFYDKSGNKTAINLKLGY